MSTIAFPSSNIAFAILTLHFWGLRERGWCFGLRFPRSTLASPLAARTAGILLGLGFAFEIERHCGADEILQGRFINLFTFVDVNGAPDIPFEAGVE